MFFPAAVLYPSPQAPAAARLAREAAADAQSQARAAREDLRMLAGDVERLLMITEALWQILREHHGYDDEELTRRVNDIDLRDGRLDGRVAPGAPPRCPSCRRAAGRLRLTCLYCGAAIERQPFAR